MDNTFEDKKRAADEEWLLFAGENLPLSKIRNVGEDKIQFVSAFSGKKYTVSARDYFGKYENAMAELSQKERDMPEKISAMRKTADNEELPEILVTDAPIRKDDADGYAEIYAGIFNGRVDFIKSALGNENKTIPDGPAKDVIDFLFAAYDNLLNDVTRRTEGKDWVKVRLDDEVFAYYYTNHEMANGLELWHMAIPPIAWFGKAS